MQRMQNDGLLPDWGLHHAIMDAYANSGDAKGVEDWIAYMRLLSEFLMICAQVAHCPDLGTHALCGSRAVADVEIGPWAVNSLLKAHLRAGNRQKIAEVFGTVSFRHQFCCLNADLLLTVCAQYFIDQKVPMQTATANMLLQSFAHAGSN